MATKNDFPILTCHKCAGVYFTRISVRSYYDVEVASTNSELPVVPIEAGDPDSNAYQCLDCGALEWAKIYKGETK